MEEDDDDGNVYLHLILKSTILARMSQILDSYEGWNFNSGNYLFTTDTK